MNIVTSILVILVLTLTYTTYNLYRKNEKQEDILARYFQFLDGLSKNIEYTDTRLKQIDSKGIFESDDEIGWFFDQIKVMQSRLNNFKLINDTEKR